VAYKICDSGLRISACGVGTPNPRKNSVFCARDTANLLRWREKMSYYYNKKCHTFKFFFNALKITRHGGFKSLNGSRRESVKGHLPFSASLLLPFSLHIPNLNRANTILSFILCSYYLYLSLSHSCFIFPCETRDFFSFTFYLFDCL
jgi:hypothetical protein